MNAADVLDRLDEERRTLAEEGETLEQLPTLTRSSSNDDAHHCIIHSTLFPGTADQAIEQQAEYYRQKGVGFEWKLYEHDQPPDMRQRLERHGFIVGPMEAVMVHDLSEQVHWMINETLAAAVVRIDHVDLVADFRRIAEAVFQKDHEFTSNQLTAAIAIGSSQHRGYIGYSGLVPVSIGRLDTHPRSHFGGLFGGGTLAAYRGLGFYRAVVAARARDAIALGARYLIVDALPTSQPILERLGFQRITNTWPCSWQPSSNE